MESEADDGFEYFHEILESKVDKLQNFQNCKLYFYKEKFSNNLVPDWYNNGVKL